MAAVYYIEKEARLVRTHATGTFGYEDAISHMTRIKKDPDFDPAFSQLLDFREVTEMILTHDEIVSLSAVEVFSRQSRRAFLVGTPEQFGLARVFQSYRSSRGDQTISVFTDAEEAFAWLRLEKHASP
jgi:hypothetical protein